MMMHENQRAKILRVIVMAVSLGKKERTIKGDRCNLAKDPLTVKSVLSIEHKDEKTMNSRTYLG